MCLSQRNNARSQTPNTPGTFPPNSRNVFQNIPTVIVLCWLHDLKICCQTYRFRNFVWIFREWWDPQAYIQVPMNVFVYYCEGLQTRFDLSTFDLSHGMLQNAPRLLLYTHVKIMRNCMYISWLWDHTTLHCSWSTHVAEILPHISTSPCSITELPLRMRLMIFMQLQSVYGLIAGSVLQPMMLFDGSFVPRPSHRPFLIPCSSFA